MELMFDLRHVRHFLAAASRSTVQEAADELCITQPALTKSIARFEEELDAKLFDRRGRRLVLTDFGQRMARRGEALLRHVGDIEEEVELWKGLGVGEVAIGVDLEVEFSLLPQVLEAFVPSHPDVSVTVRSGHTDALLPALLAGDLHFIAADSELAIGHQELVIKHLGADPLAAAIRPQHPLVMVDADAITPALFRTFPVATAISAPRYERFDAEQSRMVGVKPMVPSLVSDNYEILVRLAENSDTIVIGPHHLLATYATSKRLRVMDWPLTLNAPVTSPSLIYSEGRNFSPSAERLMTLFEQAGKNVFPPSG